MTGHLYTGIMPLFLNLVAIGNHDSIGVNDLGMRAADVNGSRTCSLSTKPRYNDNGIVP